LSKNREGERVMFMQTMKYKISLIVLYLLVGNTPSHAQEQKMSESEMATFKQSVVAVSKKIKTLTTDFVQYKHMDFLSKDIETSGKMTFKEPVLLLWQYKKPYDYSVVFNNGKILINDEGKRKNIDIGKSEIFDKINRMIVGSVSGNLFDDREFVIGYFKSKNQNIATFVPKDPALQKYIKQIELTFDKDEVVQVKLVESSTDYTRIVFKNRILNAKIDASFFNN
jgi:outer membrane lipoprotein-sorting protein